MPSRFLNRCGALVVAVATLAICAQQPQAPAVAARPGTPPAAGQNYAAQVCQRLEGQLATIDRGASGDPARAEQVRRYEEASGRQQGELDRMVEQSRRQGCESTGFFLFGGGNASSQQCVDLTRQIARMRGNLDRINVDLQRLRGGDSDRGEQRRSVMLALAQNNCGPQYRTAARAAGRLLRPAVRRATPTSRPAISPTRWRRAGRSAPSACAPATDSISRSPTRPTRRASARTRIPASGCVRPPR